LNRSELVWRIVGTFFIVFYSCVFLAYLVFSLGLLDEEISPSLGSIYIFLVMALLTSMCYLPLYSKTKLSTNQLIFRYVIGVICALIIVFFMLHTVGWAERSVYRNTFDVATIVASITIVAIVIAVARWQTISNTEREHTEKEKALYYGQLMLMQNSLEEGNSIRHDIKLHLAMIKKYLIQKREADAIKYLNGILDEFHIKTYVDTNNIVFDNVVNYKLSKAKKDVKIETNVALPHEIELEATDIVIVMGNLLENALEAVEEADEKKIRIDVFFEKGSLFIRVENSFNGEVMLKKDVTGETRIESKKINGHHGYGLKNIHKSVKKYNGKMEINYSKHIFCVNILLYLPLKESY